MGNACTVCNSEHRHAIEVALTHKTSGDVLAKRFGLSRDSILRHGRNHLLPQQRAAILTASAPVAIDLETLRTTESEGLLSQLVTQRARLEQHAQRAVALDDIKAAVAAEGGITRNLKLVGDLLGQFAQIHDVRHTSVLLTPDYLKMRSQLVEALRPFPEAGQAVGAVLHRLESDSARDITAERRPALRVIDHEPTVPPCPVPAVPC